MNCAESHDGSSFDWATYSRLSCPANDLHEPPQPHLVISHGARRAQSIQDGPPFVASLCLREGDWGGGAPGQGQIRASPAPGAAAAGNRTSTQKVGEVRLHAVTGRPRPDGLWRSGQLRLARRPFVATFGRPLPFAHPFRTRTEAGERPGGRASSCSTSHGPTPTTSTRRGSQKQTRGWGRGFLLRFGRICTHRRAGGLAGRPGGGWGSRKERREIHRAQPVAVPPPSPSPRPRPSAARTLSILGR